MKKFQKKSIHKIKTYYIAKINSLPKHVSFTLGYELELELKKPESTVWGLECVRECMCNVYVLRKMYIYVYVYLYIYMRYIDFL